MVDDSPSIDEIRGGKPTLGTTEPSDGGYGLSGQRRMVHDKMDSRPRCEKSVHKGDYIYTLADLNGNTLLNAYADWNGRLVWTTAHAEGYIAKDKNTIQFEDFDMEEE